MSLGSMISKARKDAGLSIDDLSAATNIRGPLLRQMESDNFSQCGGETYARGHIRNIATKLNIDPQIFLTAFEDEQLHVDRSMQDLLVETSVMREPGEVKKVSWKVLVTISISTLFIAGLVQIVTSNDSTPDIPVATEESVQPSASTEPTPESTEVVEAVPTEEATITVDQYKCKACSKCVNVCYSDAVRIKSNKAIIDLTKCTKCKKCIEVCPEDAIY